MQKKNRKLNKSEIYFYANYAHSLFVRVNALSALCLSNNFFSQTRKKTLFIRIRYDEKVFIKIYFCFQQSVSHPLSIELVSFIFDWSLEQLFTPLLDLGGFILPTKLKNWSMDSWCVTWNINYVNEV